MMDYGDDELFDEVDASGNVIATHPKSYFATRMFMHKASLIIPKTADGKLLLTKRAATKQPFPGTWCCAVGGKVASGEDEEGAAQREMVEEIGVAYQLIKICTFVYDKDDYKAVFTLYTTAQPIMPSEMSLNEEEIQEAQGFKLEEILRMVKENPSAFAPTFIAAIEEFAKHQGGA